MYDSIVLKFPLDDNINISDAQFDFNIAFLPCGRNSIWQRPIYNNIPSGYLPKVSVYKQTSKDSSVNLLMSAEFSIGKLIYGNNVEIPRNEDFDTIIDTLKHKLKLMGIYVTSNTLENAKVSRIDVSKTINISNYLSCYTLITSLEKVPVPQNVKHGKSSFLNNGKQFTINTDQWRFSVYDKMAEISNDKSTVPVETDVGNIEEMPLLKALKYKGVKHLLRIEYQVTKPQQLQKCLKKINHDDKDIRFKTIYNENIATNILSSFWNQYIVPHISTCAIARSQKRTLVDKAKAKNISLKKLCQLLGYKEFIKLGNAYSEFSNIYEDATPRVFLSEIEETANKLDLDKTTITKTWKYISEQIYSGVKFRIRP